MAINEICTNCEEAITAGQAVHKVEMPRRFAGLYHAACCPLCDPYIQPTLSTHDAEELAEASHDL